MRFNVPKYIDVEDKIFGPLTFKQFVYLVGGAGLDVVTIWLSPHFLITVPLVLFFSAFSLALAFWDYNGKPFIHTVQAVFYYLTSTRTYVWKHRKHEQKDEKQLNKELKQIEQSLQAKDDTISKKSVAVTVGDDTDTGQNTAPASSS